MATVAKRILMLAFTVSILSGCAFVPPRSGESGQDGINRVLDQIVCGSQESQGKTDCIKRFEDRAGDEKHTQRARHFRLLRGHMVVAGLVRLAAERIETGPDAEAEAFRVLKAAKTAEQNLKEALKITQSSDEQESAYYPIERVDALIAMVRLADAATAPSRRRGMSLLLGGKIKMLHDGPDVLLDALKDLAYINAYADSLLLQIDVLGDATFDPKTKKEAYKKAWQQYNGELRTHCAALGKIAGVNSFDCLN